MISYKVYFILSLALMLGQAFCGCLFGDENKYNLEKHNLKLPDLTKIIDKLKGPVHKFESDVSLAAELEVLSTNKYYSPRRCGFRTARILESAFLVNGDDEIYRFYQDLHAKLCVPRYEQILADEIQFKGRSEKYLQHIVIEIMEARLGRDPALEDRLKTAESMKSLIDKDVKSMFDLFITQAITLTDVDAIREASVNQEKHKELMPYLLRKFDSFIVQPCKKDSISYSNIFYPFEMDKKWLDKEGKRIKLKKRDKFMESYLLWKVCKVIIDDEELPQKVQNYFTKYVETSLQ